MTVHTIGDSHACTNGWAGTTQHHLGPVLCYSFGKEKLKRYDIRDLDIKNGDTVIFCLGEIDCRCHVHKHVTETQSYQDVIDDIIVNYFEAIKLNVSMSQLQLNVCVYNVVPPVQSFNTWENPAYPYLGSDAERKSYVVYFNKKINEKCTEYGYTFFDVYDKYADPNGFLIKDLSDGNVHIGNGMYVEEMLKRMVNSDCK